jgi:hypothetical protein
MIHLSFNIGYENSSGKGILTKYPTYYQMESFKEFSDLVRNNPFEWLLWTHEYYVPKSSLCFYLTIWEDDKNNEGEFWQWEFTVRVKNIREYLPLLKISHEEFEEMKLQRVRENKLEEILNFDLKN